ncbi:hypothetical protein AN478_11870 [Thiohalorhabdus denitrificans]|uniref:Uncharacterized protein n=1 Tax=Thiohalorhabdus denitrificans TaxID=381306 RepID=A0A0P9GG62_9GAMM|nr:hypothetical protein [Thiohalorhabdus denitrificans]KPV39016.1 hypothetical protein AN478_11870 [Thiohalorhabdus denitrificans]SCX79934.1 hypothetical protein SAMN05661077_0489 [Thiohalorhabdus denitrificans]
MKRLLRAATSRLGVTSGALAVVAAVTALSLSGVEQNREEAALDELAATERAEQGWGDRVLSSIHHGVLEQAPVNVANACGLGATSCFKCHNEGRRGPAPAMDAESDPWHPDHMEVNHSCDGCHQGNQRLMVKGIAHKEMLPDPREHPETACAECHEGGEVDGLLETYKAVDD